MEKGLDVCFKKCNEEFIPKLNPKKIYCKKGCMSESDLADSLKKDCTKVCIKVKIGNDEVSAGEWTNFFSRAPADSASCLDACFLGCHYKHFYVD